MAEMFRWEKVSHHPAKVFAVVLARSLLDCSERLTMFYVCLTGKKPLASSCSRVWSEAGYHKVN